MTLGDLLIELRCFIDDHHALIDRGIMTIDTLVGSHKVWNWKNRIVIEIKPAIPKNDAEAAEFDPS